MFVVAAKLKVAKGKEAEVDKILHNVIRQVRRSKEEKDTLIFDMHRKIDDPSEIFFYEKYKDRDAWAVTHMSQPYVKECIAALPDNLDGEVELTEYEVVEVD